MLHYDAIQLMMFLTANIPNTTTNGQKIKRGVYRNLKYQYANGRKTL